MENLRMTYSVMEVVSTKPRGWVCVLYMSEGDVAIGLHSKFGFMIDPRGKKKKVNYGNQKKMEKKKNLM